MKKRLSYVAPLQLGTVLAALYFLLSLILVPFLLLASILGAKQGAMMGAVGPLFLVILIPLLYSALGFIGGVIAAAVYNVVAKWTGGIEFAVVDAPSADL
jgi:hypothetical protein